MLQSISQREDTISDCPSHQSALRRGCRRDHCAALVEETVEVEGRRHGPRPSYREKIVRGQLLAIRFFTSVLLSRPSLPNLASWTTRIGSFCLSTNLFTAVL